MKTLAFALLTLAAQEVSAANLQIDLRLTGDIRADQLSGIHTSFGSTNPACLQLNMGVLVPRQQLVAGTARIIGSHQLLLETETRYTGNNFCLYKLRSVQIGFKGTSNWLALSSTEDDDYPLHPRENAQLEVLRNRGEFSAVCAGNRCESRVDGRAPGNPIYNNNVARFYLNAEDLTDRGNLGTVIYFQP